MSENLDLTTEPIPALIRKISIPASLAFFFHTMFNIVDTFFGGQISTQTLAALSLSFPIFFIIIALGSGFATGATALIANELGVKNEKKAAMLGMQGLSFGIFISVFLTAFGLTASEWLFTILGASDEYLEICLIYMNTIFAGSVFFIFTNMLNSVLVALGDTKSLRNILAVNFVLNIGLDPLFIFGFWIIPPMGVAGIALATVLVQILSCIYIGLKVYRSGFLKGMSLKDMIPELTAFKEIARQGIPASANMLTVGVGIFVITYFVSWFGEKGVAAYGIATRIEQIAMLPSFGLNTAVLAIIAQNNGAKKFDRIGQALKTARLYGAMISAVGIVCMLAFPRWLMELFSTDQSVVDIGVVYLRFAAFTLFAYVLLFLYVSLLQGMKKPMFAIWIGLFRQIAAPVVVFYLLARVAGMELIGIWVGIFCIAWFSALVSILYGHRVLGKVVKGGG